MEIRFNTGDLEGFRRRARQKHPVEYLEMLFGRVGEDFIEIVKSVPIKHTATLTSEGEGSCEFEEEDLAILKLKEEKDGLSWIGSAHSHCDAPCIPSESDNESALYNKEQVFGIYSFVKNPKTGRCSNSKLCFYLPQRPLTTHQDDKADRLQVLTATHS